MVTARSVLVVDGPTETEEVLKAVLEPRGLQVNRVRGQFPDNNGHAEAPAVIVLHEDSTKSGEPCPEWRAVPRVVIGSATVNEDPQADLASAYLQKPFHYGDLLAAIDRFLEHRADAE